MGGGFGGIWGHEGGYGVGYGVRAHVGAMGRVYEGRTLLWGAVGRICGVGMWGAMGRIDELTARGRCGADLWGDR